MQTSKLLPREISAGHYIIASSAYRKQVLIAQKVNELSDDVQDKDQKKKFLMRGYPPTVEQLETHNVADNFITYFPYLLYYHETELHFFNNDEGSFEETREYISDLFKTHLVIEEEERKTGPMEISEDDYEYMLKNINRVCRDSVSENNLSNYEYYTFYGEHFPTLERIQSLDVKANFERLFPFLMKYREPSLMDVKGNTEGTAIRNYLCDVFFECLEIVD